jgi:glutamate 5-kinase
MLWLAHLAATQGRLLLDPGAVKAVASGVASLLPAGITGLAGSFEAGDAVEITDAAGHVVARGLVNYSSQELPQMLGRSTHELARDLGAQFERAVVHVDDLVVV